MKLVNMPITADFAKALVEDAENGRYENEDARLGGVVMNMAKKLKNDIWFAAVRGYTEWETMFYGVDDDAINETIAMLEEAGYKVRYFEREDNVKRMAQTFHLEW